MIPADDVKLGMRPIALASDVFPRIMRISKARLCVFIMLRFERPGNPNERRAGFVVDALLAEQDAPQLEFGVAQGVPVDRVGGRLIKKNRQVFDARNLICRASESPISIGPLFLPRFPIMNVLENNLVVIFTHAYVLRFSCFSRSTNSTCSGDSRPSRTVSETRVISP